MRKSDSSQRLLRALLALSLVSQWHNVHASVSVPFVVHSPSIDINTNSKAPGDAGSFSFQNINDATGADVYVAAIKVGDQNYVVRSPTSFPCFRLFDGHVYRCNWILAAQTSGSIHPKFQLPNSPAQDWAHPLPMAMAPSHRVPFSSVQQSSEVSQCNNRPSVRSSLNSHPHRC